MQRITLFFFPHYPAARHAGFRESGIHVQDQELWAWWPERQIGELQGMPISRVVVPQCVGEWRGNEDLHRKLNDAMRLAREQLRVEPKLWMEL